MLGLSSWGRINCWFAVTESWVVYSNYRKLVSSVDGLRERTYNVRHCLLSINISFHDTILVDTDGGQNIKSFFVARIDSVKYQADHNLLPSRSALVPEL